MTEIAILLKRKLESSGSSGAAPIQSFSKVDYGRNPWDDDEIDPVIEKEYNRQFLESDVSSLESFYVKIDWFLIEFMLKVFGFDQIYAKSDLTLIELMLKWLAFAMIILKYCFLNVGRVSMLITSIFRMVVN